MLCVLSLCAQNGFANSSIDSSSAMTESAVNNVPNMTAQSEVKRREQVTPRFQFDKWVSGMDLPEILKIAEQHSLFINAHGVGDHYGYEAEIYGKPAVVSLHLTPSSHQLAWLQVTWLLDDLEYQKSHYQDVNRIIVNKYHVFRADYRMGGNHGSVWHPNDNNVILLRMQDDRVVMEYRDVKLLEQKKQERFSG